MSDGRLRALLPPNTTALEEAVAGAADEARLAPEIISSLWDAIHCPAANLPWLAWALSVDEWDDAWDEATRRAVILASVEIHRQKGTVGAVKKALTLLGHSGQILEWWETAPPGIPHTFLVDIDVSALGLTQSAAAMVERHIEAVKPVRSHFRTRLLARPVCPARVSIAPLFGEDVTLWPRISCEINALPAPYIGIGLHLYDFATISPQTTGQNP